MVASGERSRFKLTLKIYQVMKLLNQGRISIEAIIEFQFRYVLDLIKVKFVEVSRPKPAGVQLVKNFVKLIFLISI